MKKYNKLTNLVKVINWLFLLQVLLTIINRKIDIQNKLVCLYKLNGW